jgi:hypothetical protein
MPCCAASAGKTSVTALSMKEWRRRKRTRQESALSGTPVQAQLGTAQLCARTAALGAERRVTFLFFLLLHCALAEGLPPRGQVSSRGHGLVRCNWRRLGLAVAHARRVGVVLRRGRHDRRAAERASSLSAEYRGLRTMPVCCGVSASQGGPAVGWQAAGRGHSVTSQRSERKNRRSAGLAVTLQQV